MQIYYETKTNVKFNKKSIFSAIAIAIGSFLMLAYAVFFRLFEHFVISYGHRELIQDGVQYWNSYYHVTFYYISFIWAILYGILFAINLFFLGRKQRKASE